jgi:hypothetical protein
MRWTGRLHVIALPRKSHQTHNRATIRDNCGSYDVKDIFVPGTLLILIQRSYILYMKLLTRFNAIGLRCALPSDAGNKFGVYVARRVAEKPQVQPLFACHRQCQLPVYIRSIFGHCLQDQRSSSSKANALDYYLP